MFLERIVHGWERIEAPLLASVALGYPVVLIARHGTAKSLVMRALAFSLGRTVRIVSAPVQDLTSLAGLPNPKAMAEGRFELVPHGHSLQGVQVLGIDELPRAPAAVQNILLEVVLERTILGKPLDVEVIIATMNPDTYAASHSLDQALADRFAMILPVPDLQALEKSERALLLKLGYANNGASPAEFAERLADLPEFMERLRASYLTLEDQALEAVVEYAAQLLCLVHQNHSSVYISPRREVLFVRCILACAAYYHAAGLSVVEALPEGAQAAIEYALAVPLALAPESLLAYHATLRSVLTEGQLSERDAYLLQASNLSPPDLLAYLGSTADKAVHLLTGAEREKVIGRLVDASKIDPLTLWELIDKIAPNSPLRDQALVRLVQAYVAEYNALVHAIGQFLVADQAGEEQARQLGRLLEKYAGPRVTPAMIRAVGEAKAAATGKEKSPEAITAILERGLSVHPA